MNKKLIGILFGMLAAGTVNATVIANLEDVTNGGGFFATVTFEDILGGGVTVSADIADPINVGLTQGDILGLGFHIATESLLPLLIANNGSENPLSIITGTCQLANSCDLFNGGGSGSPGNGFDIRVDLGINGAPAGFIETLSFEIFASGLTALEFADQSVGMRVQSIEGTVYAAGSSKLIGDGPPPPPPPPDPDPNPVPIPGTLALLGLGLMGLRMTGRRRQRS